MAEDVEKLEQRMTEVEKELNKGNVQFTAISKDLEFIKQLVGEAFNGKFRDLAGTVSDLSKKITEDVCPFVRENTFWIGKVKWAAVWISVIAVGGGLAGVAWIIVKKALGLL